MSTSFSSLPVVDVGALKDPKVRTKDIAQLSQQLHDVFATTGFAYLINPPLSFDHEEIFEVSREFFAMPLDQKMKLAKKSFRPTHTSTYRGYACEIYMKFMILIVSDIFRRSHILPRII